ncbi:ABC transporter ATP-binding protein [Primorskyibacter sp. S187A]|uniref:ABC transporter ATP-binding protein n=1 Tax=Primorskyibacter sp. S187A TaxID=3415130 RepID=UPI003C7B1E9F
MTRNTLSEQPNSRGLLRWIWTRYMAKHWALLLAAMAFMTIEGAMFGALSYMMKPMFDEVFIGGRNDLLIWVGVAFFAIFTTRAVASVIQSQLLTRLSQKTVAEIRIDLVTHLMTLEGQFHQTYTPGYIAQRVNGDVNSVNKVWSAIITGAGRDVIALLALFGVALSIDWVWTLIALIGVPLLVLPAVVVQRFVRQTSREARDLSAAMSVRLNEIFQGITPVKLNQLEGYQIGHYTRLTKERIRLAIRASFGSAAIPGMIDIMSGLGFFAVLLYGGEAILSGEKTVGDFMAFFTALGLAFEPLRRLGKLSGVWQVAAAGLERLRELLELVPAQRDPAHPVPPPAGRPDIVFDAVDMQYDDAPVLRGLTFTAEAGKTTALVGASGAGKSTVFSVLTRLVDAQKGHVKIGGVNHDQITLKDLRGMFSVVSQEALLFDDTLRENITLDQPGVSEEALAQAVEAARVSEFLDQLPKGLDSRTGPRGSNLSGGQRQRVSIARAILRNRPILLLDEATSALDMRSEALVQEALEQASEGRTTLVIAHRLSTIRNADKIVVMEAGRVLEEGTHDALLEKGGAYAELYAMQFNRDSDPKDPAEMPRQDSA